MDRKYRGHDGRALPWSRTGPGIRRIRRLLIKRAVIAGVAAAGLLSVKGVSSAKAQSAEQKIAKALAIAEAVIKTNIQIININNRLP